MKKDMILYVGLIVISFVIYFILIKNKSRVLNQKKKDLEIQQKTSKRIIRIFYKILNNN